MLDDIKKQLRDSAILKEKIAVELSDKIAEIAKVCRIAVTSCSKIMFCGNGGSAADSQHLATELVVRLTSDSNRKALPALALTTDTSILTAAANDFGFDNIFSRQIEALGRQGDVLIALSTSGNSANVIKAVETAQKLNIHTVALSGGDGGKLASLANDALIVPSDSVMRTQEAHITIGHILISLIEKEL